MNTHKIGETILWYEKPDKIVKLKVVQDKNGEHCKNCYFRKHSHISYVTFDYVDPCAARDRDDRLAIHFEEEK